ncbi:MAG TPA: enoyl-CoA hydratase/isomerase family protein [Acidimicrobiales bacterium]|nr:enoyl-CoA hydratase/isomerase family protein [Acidimicrobiales bacterium]
MSGDGVTYGELREALSSPAVLEELTDREVPVLQVDMGDATAAPGVVAAAGPGEVRAGDEMVDQEVAGRWAALPLVLVGVGEPAEPQSAAAALVDVAVGADRSAAEAVFQAVAHHPMASVALSLLLRAGGSLSIAEGLVAESAAYSMLQSGPEFAAWLAGQPLPDRFASPAPDQGAVVLVRRVADSLEITLNRPAVHNALSAQMRDELHAALLVAAADAGLSVHLGGNGPSFCSGGDLSEFGTLPDPASAHLVRLRRSAGLLLAGMSDRLEVSLHGACRGAGIELPAFAGRVTADRSTSIALPEVGLGLIPGAGGTVSLRRRIGRHRTAWLALSGAVIDAPTALRWGLVDAIRG